MQITLPARNALDMLVAIQTHVPPCDTTQTRNALCDFQKLAFAPGLVSIGEKSGIGRERQIELNFKSLYSYILLRVKENGIACALPAYFI
ncbi:MAG: hypothetical protein IPH31_26725 [Lewinellaceae bacterium]|nr:hypothetical protein [Lewinellaceae bacterium]